MRRFIITHPNFTGEAEIIFKIDGALAAINLYDATMDSETLNKFKSFVPAHINDIEKFKQSKAVVVEADFEVSFDMYWKKYNKKINKIRAKNVWDKLNKTEQVQAFYAIDDYDKYLAANKWRPKADPETYLRNKYWTNEYQ